MRIISLKEFLRRLFRVMEKNYEKKAGKSNPTSCYQSLTKKIVASK
jgi:hypothetical protein